MSSGWTDTELKRLAFDYIRGELSIDESEVIEARIQDSPEFAEYVSKLTLMLGGAKEAPAETHFAFDQNDLFARIAAEVSAPEPQDESDDEEPLSVERGRGVWVALAAAAALILVLVAAFLVNEEAPRPVAPELATKPVPELAPKPGFQNLKAHHAESDRVRVFSTQDASFQIEGELEKELTLNDGMILVEYVSSPGERLRVQGDGFQVLVTGTVFYASNESGGVVGVVTGSVRVMPDRGAPVNVKAGQEYVLNEGLRMVEPERLKGAEEWVSVESHLDRLANQRAEPPLPPEKPEREVKKKPETQAVPKHKVARELRGRAQDALARGDFERASELMEELLGQIPASDPVAGTVRLDLSRIYLKNLKEPQRAAHHLRQFVKSRPADAATPLAKEELCRIVSESGSVDPLCVP